MGSDTRPVCHRCAQIKQACDGSLPCARCVRLSLPCRPRNSSAGSSDDAQTGDMPKARIRRVQTGCLMCKRRKKKCDETKPRCGDCRRLCLDCEWPPERHSRARAASAVGAPDVMAHAALGAVVAGFMPAKPEVAMMEIPIRSTPSPVSTPASARHSSPGSFADHVSHHSLTFGHQTLDHQPMAAIPMPPTTTTMAGEMALELMSPDSLSWDMASSPQGWIEAITPVSNDSPAASVDSTPVSSLSLYVPQLLPQLHAPQDKALLNHYSTIVSAILSRRCSSSNPYNHYLLPLAQGNDLVLHCILALSANHWRKLQPSLGDRGLYHKSKATQALARLLPHVDKTSADLALVSSLLLCMTELFDGTSEGWKLHLKGAKRLLMTLKKQQGDMMTGHYKFLLRLARFLDSAATTSTCRPPLIGEEEAEAAALDRMTSSPDEEDSAVYGIPKELFHLVDRVNTLADLRSTRVDPASEAAFREHAQEIEERINNWSFEYGGMSRAAWTFSPANDDVLYATMAFENAIRLRLHQIVEGYELTDPKVGQFVEGIVDAVQKIRYGSPLESCLVFPLVMAGGACWKLEHRVVIQDRLLIMERTCGFGYIYNARDLVERVWSRRDQSDGTGDIVNWARIRYYEMNGLVLF
ncbi:fungal specific transcription factor [Hirsutella rhossiliensis]|uniref:Fungal specific transcription factor domain-containing protein n=1 Tax=Hirsutella rhossiliensis TaxID=111463 RepID=A0A9P8MNC1_9HYPO|nr:fungal specific transcription factor domain-containing protein [Hirsutella rhossiliensis]KAH0958300.1 fungal specific transcription factor domain-containing protein [Hirsutella rhossiliensis]